MISASILKRKRSTFFDLSDQTIVTLKIGPDKKTFNIHRELLCQRSPYFKAAFKEQFKEAEDRNIDLVDTSTETFELVMKWLYTQVFDPAPVDKKIIDYSTGDGADDEYEMSDAPVPPEWEIVRKWQEIALSVYIFADKYDLAALRLKILKEWQECIELTRLRLPDLSLVNKAFGNLPAESPLCQYIIAHFNEEWTVDKATKHTRENELPYDFLVGVLLLGRPQSSSWPGPSRLRRDRCTFHEHNSISDEIECNRRREGRDRDRGIRNKEKDRAMRKGQ